MRFPRFLVLLPLAAMLFAASASAQGTTVTVDTLSLVGRSAPEEGYLSLMNLDRLIVGPRSSGMGGTGIAIQGGSEYLTLNPASILGMTRIELQAEGHYLVGGAGVNRFPRLIDVGGGQFLDASNYRVSPGSGFSYNSLTFGSPVVLFGGRGAVSFGFTHTSRTGRSDESRSELVGPVTNNLESTYGLGRNSEQGMDAISGTIARSFGILDLGTTFNWKSGKLRREDEAGVTVFGFQILGSNTKYEQEVKAFNIDLGAQADLGPLRVGGSLFLGHDMEYSNGFASVRPLPNPQFPNEQFLIFYGLQNHTVKVPTMFGVGASYQLSDRMLLAGDYWGRPWSGVTMERGALTPVFGFEDVADSSTFFWALTEGEGTEEVDMQLSDTNSLRLGLEYLASNRENFKLPVRLGFRKEKLTRNNINVPQEYTRQDQLILAYWRQLIAGDPSAEVTETQLADLFEHNILMFQGTPINTTVISLGAGVEIDNFGADLGIELQNFTINNFFLDDYDPLTNNLPPTITEETRRLLTMSIAVRWKF